MFIQYQYSSLNLNLQVEVLQEIGVTTVKRAGDGFVVNGLAMGPGLARDLLARIRQRGFIVSLEDLRSALTSFVLICPRGGA